MDFLRRWAALVEMRSTAPTRGFAAADQAAKPGADVTVRVARKSGQAFAPFRRRAAERASVEKVLLSSRNHHSSMSAASHPTDLLVMAQGWRFFHVQEVYDRHGNDWLADTWRRWWNLSGVRNCTVAGNRSRHRLGWSGFHSGGAPHVEVRVGNSNPVPVLLDTGSSGLHIFDTAVNTGTGSGVTLTSQPANITYAGGHRFTGVVANAVVTIGSYATKLPVSFAYVEQAFCIPSKPTCPRPAAFPDLNSRACTASLALGPNRAAVGLPARFWACPDRSERNGVSTWRAERERSRSEPGFLPDVPPRPFR